MMRKKYISSNYYDLVLKKYTRPTHEDYGGIDILNKKLFYVDNDGYGWVLKNENFEKVISKPLDLNEESFLIRKTIIHEKWVTKIINEKIYLCIFKKYLVLHSIIRNNF